MKEVKSPKKPLLYYYGIVLLILVIFNVIVTPMITKSMVREVDYGTFMSKIEDKKIEDVQIEDNQILFTDKDDSSIVYKTGVMDDPILQSVFIMPERSFPRRSISRYHRWQVFCSQVFFRW